MKDFTMQEMTLSRDAQIALWQMINKTPNCTAKEIAQAIGDSHNTVCNYGNQNMPSYLPSMKKLEAMIFFTQNPALLKVWAHELGFALVPVGCNSSKHHELSIFEAMMQHNIKNGKANRVVYDAYEDGIITPMEYEEIHQLTQNLIELITAVDQAALKQMKKCTAQLGNEKA